MNVDDLAAVAADSRASLDILMLDVAQFDASAVAAADDPRGTTAGCRKKDSSRWRAWPADGLYRINASATYAFERIGLAP